MTNSQLLSRLTIQGNCELLTAMKQLDDVGMGVLFVVDLQGKMVGMLTDGDIRRALLRGEKFSTPLLSVMNTKFSKGIAGQSYEESINQLRHLQRRHLPIVDEKGYLVDIVLSGVNAFSHVDTTVVLMAGGLGSRLGNLTRETPKPMLPVGKAPMLESIMMSFIHEGFEQFYLAVNYKSHILEDYFRDGSRWGVSIKYLREEKRLGTAGALGLLPDRPNGAFVVMNADVVTDINFHNLLNYHDETKSKATMAVRKYQMQIPFGVVELKGHHLGKIVEKPIQEYFINAGIYVLEPDCLDLIPENFYMDMTEVFQALVVGGETPATYLIHEYWKDIGSLKDYETAITDLDNRRDD